MNENMQVLESLKKKEKQLEDDLRHIRAVIKLYESEQSSDEMETESVVPLESLHGLTQVQALVKIARASGGRFRIKDARTLLIRAGLINSKKGNEANILHSTITRSEKFRRVGFGEYELIERKPTILETAFAKQSSAG